MATDSYYDRGYFTARINAHRKECARIAAGFITVPDDKDLIQVVFAFALSEAENDRPTVENGVEE